MLKLTIVREIVQINIHSGASSAGSSLRVQVAHRLPLDIVHEFDELDELEDLVSEELEVVPVGVGVCTDFGEGAAEISSHDRARFSQKEKRIASLTRRRFELRHRT